MTDKEKYIALVRGIDREGADVGGFLSFLEGSDFYTAPASTKYHNCFEGGLVKHCLNVYDTLVRLNSMMGCSYTSSSLLIVALTHDLAKVNFYTKEIKNKKTYSPKGSKVDSMGRFDWESVEGWGIREPKDLTLFGSHEENSYYLASRFFPLSTEEASAIINHHAGMGSNASPSTLSPIFNQYSLVVLLHTADFLSTYVIERITYE